MTSDIDHAVAQADAAMLEAHREQVMQRWLEHQLGPGPWRSADVTRERARLMGAWQLARAKGIPTRLDQRPPRPASVDWAAIDAAKAAAAAAVTGEVRECGYEQCAETFEVRVQAKAQQFCGRTCKRKQTFINQRQRAERRAAAG